MKTLPLSPDLKVERADHHIQDIQRRVQTFLATDPYRVACKVDPDTRKPTYYLASVEPVPEAFGLLAADVIQNLRSALDHLAFLLVSQGPGPHAASAHRISFPIFDSAALYEAKKRGKIGGMRQEAINAIDGIKPYKGGNDLLWMLNRLNNIDKHRMLFVVGSRFIDFDVAPSMAAALPDAGSFGELKRGLSAIQIRLAPADKGFPLEPGFKLYVGAPDEKPNPNQKFTFDVALGEQGAAEGLPILDTLKSLKHATVEVIGRLKPFLIDKC